MIFGKNIVDTLSTDDYNGETVLLKQASYMQNDKRLQINSDGRNYFVDVLGQGHKSSLALTLLTNDVEQTILLIDEIENHHHSSSLRSVISSLIAKCIANDLQVFLTTHSPEVIQQFSQNPETKIFHLFKNKNKKIRSNEIQFNDMKLIRDLGVDIGSLLKFETLLIVEGTTD